MNFLKHKREGFQIYESLLWEDGAYFLLDYHIQRIAASAAFFSFKMDENVFLTTLRKNRDSLQAGSSYKVKIAIDEQGRPTVTNEIIIPDTENDLRIALCSRTVSSEDPFLYHKTTKRDLYDTVLKKAQARGFWDVVFRNERGEITEGGRSNIFIKENDTLLTPAVSCGLLAGTMRRYLLENRENAGEAVITLPRLRAAREIFMCNSVRKIVNVTLSETVL